MSVVLSGHFIVIEHSDDASLLNREYLAQQIDNIINCILKKHNKGKVLRVLIHFHGGLTSENDGLQSASKLLPLYLEAGVHPIFIIWKTGFFETLTRNIHSITATKFFHVILEYTLRSVCGIAEIFHNDGSKGSEFILTAVNETPHDFPSFTHSCDISNCTAKKKSFAEDFAWFEEQCEEQIKDAFVHDGNIGQDLFREIKEVEQFSQLLQNELAMEGGTRGPVLTCLARCVLRVAKRVIERWLEQRDHGLHATTIEEVLRECFADKFGKWIWGGMKGIAENICSDTTKNSGICLQLVNRLSKLEENGTRLSVDLVGHSAGSIPICHLLNSEKISLIYRNVIFLAPACQLDLFYDNIIQKPNRYSTFRMFTMCDELEKNNAMIDDVMQGFGFLYPSSLLYFISGVLEEEPDCPIAGMHRFLQGSTPFNKEPYKSCSEFLFSHDRIVLADTRTTSPQNNTHLESSAKTHSSFMTDLATLNSIQTIISKADL